MDNFLYHGSSIKNLDVIVPHKSTHGEYVYATDDYACALVFSAPIGGDLIYSLGRNTKEEPYSFVELIPHSFDKLLNASSTIYKVPSTTFKDINTGFNEYVSREEVPVIESKIIDNIGEELAKEEKQGHIKIYRYPNKPENFIDYHKKQYIIDNPKLYLLHHPDEIDYVNEINKTKINFQDLLLFFSVYLQKNTNREKISEIILVNLINSYPNNKKEILDTYYNSRLLASNEDFIIMGDSITKENAIKLLEELTIEKDKISKLFKYNNKEKITINIFSNPIDYRLFTNLFTEVSNDSYSSYLPNNNMINVTTNNNLNQLKERILYYVVQLISDHSGLVKDFCLKNAIGLYLSNGFKYMEEPVDMRNWFTDAILRIDRIIPSSLSFIKKYNGEYKLNNGNKIGILILKYLLETKSLEEIMNEIDKLDDSIIDLSVNYYMSKYSIKKNLYDAKNLQDVMDWMNMNIVYGYTDINNELHFFNIDGIEENGIIINNDKLIQNKVGTCIDQGKFIGYIFYQFGLDAHFYYIHPKEEYKDDSHLAVVAYDYKVNKWIYFEHSNCLKRGIKVYDSIDEALKEINDHNREVVELPTIPDDIKFTDFIEYVKEHENVKAITLS